MFNLYKIDLSGKKNHNQFLEPPSNLPTQVLQRQGVKPMKQSSRRCGLVVGIVQCTIDLTIFFFQKRDTTFRFFGEIQQQLLDPNLLMYFWFYPVLGTMSFKYFGTIPLMWEWLWGLEGTSCCCQKWRWVGRKGGESKELRELRRVVELSMLLDASGLYVLFVFVGKMTGFW